MLVAALLSDLNSLSVCPPSAALALVSVHRTDSTTSQSQTQVLSSASTAETSSSPAIALANDLISLHHEVKLQYAEHGLDEEMLQARRDVQKVLRSLKG